MVTLRILLIDIQQPENTLCCVSSSSSVFPALSLGSSILGEIFVYVAGFF